MTSFESAQNGQMSLGGSARKVVENGVSEWGHHTLKISTFSIENGLLI